MLKFILVLPHSILAMLFSTQKGHGKHIVHFMKQKSVKCTLALLKNTIITLAGIHPCSTIYFVVYIRFEQMWQFIIIRIIFSYFNLVLFRQKNKIFNVNSCHNSAIYIILHHCCPNTLANLCFSVTGAIINNYEGLYYILTLM